MLTSFTTSMVCAVVRYQRHATAITMSSEALNYAMLKYGRGTWHSGFRGDAYDYYTDANGNNKQFVIRIAPIASLPKHIRQHLHHHLQQPQQHQLQREMSQTPGDDVQDVAADVLMTIKITIASGVNVSNRMFRRSFTNAQHVWQVALCKTRRIPTATPRAKDAAILSER